MNEEKSRSGPPPRKPSQSAAQIDSAGSADAQRNKGGRPKVEQKFPIYDSMEQAAARSKIPFEILKEAKSSGCPAFRHDRVDTGAFIAWYFEQNLSAEERENWTRRDKRASALGKEHDLDRKRKLVIDRDFVLQGIGAVVGFFSQELDRLAQELPATLKGRNEVQIRTEVVKQKAAIKRSLDARLEKFSKEATE